MKVLLFIALAIAAVSASESDRLCPSGYSYMGEDTPSLPIPTPKEPNPDADFNNDNLHYEEASRSPVYSCYRLAPNAMTLPSAVAYCNSEEGSELASFQDDMESKRLLSYMSDNEDLYVMSEGRLDLMTSGMYFQGHDWFWLAANQSVTQDVMKPASSMGDEVFGTCIALEINTNEPLLVPTLKAVDCFEPLVPVCEVRVQTVTYYSWFVANWVDMLLGFLLVILFVALCVSVCSYSSSHNGRRPAPGRRPRTTPAHHNNMAHHQQNVIHDMPPSYDATVVMEEKPTATSQQSQQTRSQYYAARGRELLAKVYFFKPATAK